MVTFFTRLTDNFSEFTNSQKSVANYLIDNQDSIAFCTLEDLASRIGVSTTTVIRFSRALGYKGYSEMQKDIQSNIKNKVALPERLTKSDTQIPNNQLLQESFTLDIQNIQKTMAAQKDEDLEDTIQSLSKARRIYILGMRSSFAIAHYFTSRIGEIKENVKLIQSTGMIYPEEIIEAGEGDVCVAFMFPRYSKMVAASLSWMKNEGVKIILITSLNAAAVSGYGHIILPCSISSNYFKNSLAAPLCLTNFLTAALAEYNVDESRQVLQKIESLLSQGFYLGL